MCREVTDFEFFPQNPSSDMQKIAKCFVSSSANHPPLVWCHAHIMTYPPTHFTKWHFNFGVVFHHAYLLVVPLLFTLKFEVNTSCTTFHLYRQTCIQYCMYAYLYSIQQQHTYYVVPIIYLSKKCFLTEIIIILNFSTCCSPNLLLRDADIQCNNLNSLFSVLSVK